MAVTGIKGQMLKLSPPIDQISENYMRSESFLKSDASDSHEQYGWESENHLGNAQSDA